ncbi:hypothetical protein EON66_09300 [archaeon]|nr:MAG: hypothetical protein EON66_09300 [archaeon]
MLAAAGVRSGGGGVAVSLAPDVSPAQTAAIDAAWRALSSQHTQMLRTLGSRLQAVTLVSEAWDAGDVDEAIAQAVHACETDASAGAHILSALTGKKGQVSSDVAIALTPLILTLLTSSNKECVAHLRAFVPFLRAHTRVRACNVAPPPYVGYSAHHVQGPGSRHGIVVNFDVLIL